jgi:hypothetical protein
VKAAELLAIDVAGELQAVCREQLRGSWQVAAELARLGLQRGAGAVEMTSLRHGFSLRCPGASLDPEELGQLHALCVRSADPGRRHDAVEGLEAAQAQALLWAIGVEGARVEMTAWRDGTRCALRARLGGDSTLEHSNAPERSNGFEIRVISTRLDRRRTLRWAETALRFAPVPLRIDGTRRDGGFERCLCETSIDRPLPGRIAITAVGDAPHLWLLRHGVLATRAVVPGFPAFEAALEMGPLVRAGAGPDELREAVNPHLPALIDRAVSMMVEVADRLPSLAEYTRDRLTCLLLRAARMTIQHERILALPLVRVADGSRVTRWWSPNQLAADGGTVFACDALDLVRRDTVRDGVPLVVASSEQRGLLAEVIGVALQQAPRQPRRFDPRRGAAALRRRLERALQSIWGVACAPVVPGEDLLAAERELLEELNHRVAPSTQVRLCAGAGPIRRRGSVLLLPRQNRLVAGSVRMVSEGSGWRYPVVLALLGDRAGTLGDLRDRWLQHSLGHGVPGHMGQGRNRGARQHAGRSAPQSGGTTTGAASGPS